MAQRRTMRSNVIVSQGGKTGAGGTFLRDQNVSEKQAENIPPSLLDVTSEPGQPTPQQPGTAAAAKPSVPPPTKPTPPEHIKPPESAKALRRKVWSAPKMLNLAKQEGIEATGLDKDGLRALLTSHFGLK